jgi:hypothetical protein
MKGMSSPDGQVSGMAEDSAPLAACWAQLASQASTRAITRVTGASLTKQAPIPERVAPVARRDRADATLTRCRKPYLRLVDLGGSVRRGSCRDWSRDR